MTVHNRRHKKQILQEASLLLEYNRVKSRTKPGDKVLWECVENIYSELPLTEERLHEQKAIVNWISKLGKNAIGAIKKYASSADAETKKIAQDLANKAESDPIGGKIKNFLKQGNWKDAFTTASGWITDQTQTGDNLQEISLQSIGDWWRNNTPRRVILTLSFLVLMFVSATPQKKAQADDNTQAKIEYSLDGESVPDINDADKVFGDNTQSPNQLKFGDKSIGTVGFETGVSFELGSSILDAQGLKQIDDIASDYIDKIQAALDNGDLVESLDIEVQGGASNTGDGWDKDNKYDGSLTENRASEGANKLNDSLKKQAQQRGMDLSGIDINYSVGGMDGSDLGGDENVKSGEKTSTQNTLFNGVLTHEAPTQEVPTGVDLGMQDYEMAKFGGEPRPTTGPGGDDDFSPGTVRGSRNLELRDLLYLGGIDPIPVTFGDYKSDAEMGRVDWRDIDIQGDKFLEDQQKMAVWITNTRKSKFPILKRIQNALQGVIDIEFDGGKKYVGNVGPKYDPSTTTPLTQKRNTGPRGPNKFIPDVERGGYITNPALTEAKGELPPEVIKQPEIPQEVKSIQGNTTALWKYILGDKAIGNLITSQVAKEFDKNINQVLQQLDLMYGKSGTRGNVNFRYRRNPNYKGSKYSEIPTTWNKKISGEPKETQTVDWNKASDEELAAIGASRYKKGGQDILIPPPNGWPGPSPEVLPFVSSYTGDYVQGTTGPLVGSASAEDLQEEINRIKKLLL